MDADAQERGDGDVVCEDEDRRGWTERPRGEVVADVEGGCGGVVP